jgi:hypothetical protein
MRMCGAMGTKMAAGYENDEEQLKLAAVLFIIVFKNAYNQNSPNNIVGNYWDNLSRSPCKLQLQLC